MHADISLPYSGSCQTGIIPALRTRGHLIAFRSHTSIYAQLRAGSASTLCTTLLHRNCGVALGVWRFKVLPLFGVFHSLTIPLQRVAKCRVVPCRKACRTALDSICQILSMHVTRTRLLIGGLTERLAIPNDAIREHPQAGRM